MQSYKSDSVFLGLNLESLNVSGILLRDENVPGSVENPVKGETKYMSCIGVKTERGRTAAMMAEIQSVTTACDKQ